MARQAYGENSWCPENPIRTVFVDDSFQEKHYRALATHYDDSLVRVLLRFLPLYSGTKRGRRPLQVHRTEQASMVRVWHMPTQYSECCAGDLLNAVALPPAQGMGGGEALSSFVCTDRAA